MAYMGIPLPRPTVEQIWMQTNQLDQMAQRIEEINSLAFQLTEDLALQANIQYFAAHAAVTRQSVVSLHESASRLLNFMNSMGAVIFVHPADEAEQSTN